MHYRTASCFASRCSPRPSPSPCRREAGKRDNSVKLAADQVPGEPGRLFQQCAHRRDPGAPHLGHAGLPRSEDQRIQAFACDRLALGRRQDARIRSAQRREIPQRRGLRRRRRGVHAQFRVQAGEQVDHAAERQLDRIGRENRSVQGAHPPEEAVSRGAGIPRRPGGDLPGRVLRQGRPQGHEREAGRLRALHGGREPAGAAGAPEAQPRLFQGQPQAAAEDRDAGAAPDPGPEHADRGTDGRRAGLDIQRAARPGASS